ncbi:WYL domain-containing protein [Clostridium sp. 3-3]|uniref:helix-turn-helix transcriptional regulator n=1 Tax=Clostridium sp. 3-3 TaxID=2070757 RepID=UPI000CDA6EF7|nr:WYL domain-containing protein [Clostridium sp. 3-3]POO85446.1 transcriptional regulator [Clostridium sp. 3-3]
MDSLGNVIKMLFLLKKHRKVKIKDISRELEVSERQVKRYKSQLERYFYIESVTGSEGGYILKDDYFPFKNILTEHEISKLKMIVNSMDNGNDNEVHNIIDKLNLKIFNVNNEFNLERIIPYSKPINYGNDEKYNELINAIKEHKEIIIEYRSNNGKISNRKVQPYKLFLYKNYYYLVGQCLLRNEIRYFKLVRIKELIVTSFEFNPNIDIDVFLKTQEENNLGIYGGQVVDIELEISLPMSNTIKENIWVDEQEIIERDNGSIIFKAKMKDGPEVISWLLSMGECVKIISPKELRCNLKKKIEIMIKKLSIED